MPSTFFEIILGGYFHNKYKFRTALTIMMMPITFPAVPSPVCKHTYTVNQLTVIIEEEGKVPSGTVPMKSKYIALPQALYKKPKYC